jgi:hypothetical protein
LHIGEISAAASLWGRRLAFAVAAVLTTAPALSDRATADAPTSDVLAADGLQIPEPCRISREEFQVAAHENIWIAPVSAGVWVALVTCEHHAYQATDVALRLERRDGDWLQTLLAFPTWRESEGTPWPYLAYHPWLTGWADLADGGRVSLHYKGRGVGDCGEGIVYDVSAPVVRVVEYRAKFECDGEYVDPGDWPAVPQPVLEAYAPAVADRRAGALLSAVILRWPRADWMGHAIARGDLTGDGREEQWVGGYSRDWDTKETTYHLVMEEDGRLRSWDLPVASDEQTSLCFPAATLGFESPDVLAIDDGGCDRVRVGWDASKSTITLTRG